MLPIVQNVPVPPGDLFGASINSSSENVNARDLPVSIVPKPADTIKAENDLRGKSPFFENKILENEIKKKNQNFVNNSLKTISTSLDYLEGIDVENVESSDERISDDLDEIQSEVTSIEQAAEEFDDNSANIPEIKFQQASKIFESIIKLSPAQGESDIGIYKPNSIIV